MKTCACGGTYLRHGKAVESKLRKHEDAQRYICKRCRKCITVRNGVISNPKSGRPYVPDWRDGV